LDVVVNAIGPETFTYRSLVETIGRAIGKVRPIISVPPGLGYAVGWLVGKVVGDVVVTKPEIEGLMSGLLCVDTAPTGKTALSSWAAEHASSLGVRYASEMARRRDRTAAYQPAA
jgi:hypothetical protein